MKTWKSEIVAVALLLPVLLSVRTVAQSPTPADAIALVGITNAAVNVNATYPAGSVTVNNLYLEMDTRP